MRTQLMETRVLNCRTRCTQLPNQVPDSLDQCVRLYVCVCVRVCVSVYVRAVRAYLYWFRLKGSAYIRCAAAF